jgi:endonuclease/exonuclease/phosphatase family metal-dependent hydrolase
MMVRTLPLFGVQRLCAAVAACAVLATPRAAPSTLTVMTLNTRHGGAPPWSAAEQIAEIVAERPDVVFLQEAAYTQLKEYLDGVNRGLGTRAWHGDASRHCRAGTPERCTRLGDESVMILSRLPFEEVDRHLLWAPDTAWVARAVLRARIRAGDAVSMELFSAHLPSGEDGEAARRRWVTEFRSWAKRFGGPQIVAGDFNDGPGSAPIAMMTRDYVDAWAARGRGSAGTETEDDRTYAHRYDYVFSRGNVRVERAVVRRVTLSDHRPLVAVLALPAAR